MIEINIWGSLVAALSAFVLGGLWYSPVLFGKLWGEAAGIDPKADNGHPAKVFGVSFLFSLLAAMVMSQALGDDPSLGRGAYLGLLVGVGCVAASFGINYQFANRGLPLLLIDGAYHATQFLVYGLILGAWPS